MKKAILFDLDGTLTDSGEGIINCAQYAFQQMGYPVPPREEMGVFVGPPLWDTFEKFGIPKERTDEAVQIFRSRYVPIGKFENTPYPGIRELLHRFRAAGGKICVVSHSSRENITRDYGIHFDMQPDDIFGWDLPEEQRKPSTYPLEQIMRKYGFTPKDLLVVDDMKPAWQMAKKAGCDIAFAGWSRKDCPEISREMEKLCTYHFGSPQDLEKLLFEDLTDMV